MERFVALFDAHWGYERKSGHKVSLHDPRAIRSVLKFIADFKPHHLVLGGDMLDCAVISHHNRNTPGRTEGLRVLHDAQELQSQFLAPLEELVSKRLIYHIGNHEQWLDDLSNELPGLEGLVDLRTMLGLGRRWELIYQGKASHLGKLIFIHGDQIGGGEHAAKSAVITYNRNVRFGHRHTYAVYTKMSPIEDDAHTGISVPCLCRRGPSYGKGKPNKWCQGFLWGYLLPRGNFADYVSIILNGTCVINGKSYTG